MLGLGRTGTVAVLVVSAVTIVAVSMFVVLRRRRYRRDAAG